MRPPDELTGEEIAAAVERWWAAGLTRRDFREALAILVDEGDPYPGKTHEEVLDFLERSYVANVLAEEAEHGLAFARRLAFAYFDQLAKRLAPAEHAKLIRSLPTRERHIYRARFGFDRPRRSVPVRRPHRPRASRRRSIRTRRAKARAPSGEDPSDPDPLVPAIHCWAHELGRFGARRAAA